MDMSGTIQWCILHFLLLVLLWPIMAKSQKLQQYCTFTPQHTMCRTTGIGPTCGQNVPARGVSGADAAVIVASHNRYRARVAQGQEVRGTPGPQPQAADMLEMIWDEELALIAQRHTDQCVFEHECADCRQVERFGVGQNLYMAFESSADLTTSWDSAIDAWYDEVGLMPNSEVSSYKFNPSTGHYTQLVWGSTSLVGCGFTMFEEGGWYKKLYTCNYGPAGNIMFTAMYLTGPPCSSCPQGTSCSVAHPGLCATRQLPYSRSSNFLQPFITATSAVPRFIRDITDVEDVILLFPDPKTDINFDSFGRSDLLIDFAPEPGQENVKESEGFFVTSLKEDESLLEELSHELLKGQSLTVEVETKNSPDNDEDKSIADVEHVNERRNNFLRRPPRRDHLRKLAERNGKQVSRFRGRRPNFRRRTNGDRKLMPLGKGVRVQEHFETNLSRNNTETIPKEKRRLVEPRSRFQSLQKLDEDYFDNANQDIVSREDRLTEDLDYYSEEESVRQWYFDYDDQYLDYERIAEVHSSEKKIVAVEDTTTLKTMNSMTPTPNTQTSTSLPQLILTANEASSEFMNTNELIKIHHASDLTKVSVLLTFFNNQDLFGMLKKGGTHTQTFNQLVRNLTDEPQSPITIKPLSVQEGKTRSANAFLPASEGLKNENGVASNTDPKGTRSGQTIAENIAAVKPSSKNQGTGTSRSLVQSQPTVNQLVATLNQLDLSQLTIPGLLNLLTAASAGNAQASIESSSPFDQLLNTIRTQTNTKSSNNLLTSTDVQEANNAQTLSSTNAQAFSNLQSPSRSLLSELPPHPATLALQRQRQKGERRRLQPSEPQQVTAGQLDVERQRVNSTGQSSPPTVVDPRILHVLPAADTLNKFLINVGKDSQIIKTDSLASVRDVLSTLPVGSNPLVYFRSNMGTLRQLSDRGLLAAASADAKTRPRRTRSTKPPAMQLLDSAEVLHPQTSLVEDHSMLHSSQSLTTDSKGGIGSSPVSSKLAAVPVGPAFGSSEETLLSCRNAAAPCPVVTLAGNWTHESAVDHNAIRSVLAPGVGGQVVLGRALPSPASKAACVSLSHRFVGVDEPSPQVAVSEDTHHTS
ncbi:CAP domain [Trinorchestia longiramus]|nr:CAP domain [Trinorchestia longiramus]